MLGISRFSEFKEIVNLKPLLKKIDYGSLISDNRKIIDPRNGEKRNLHIYSSKD